LGGENSGGISKCGNWQRQYANFHRRSLQGELPPRFAVALVVEAGLADRLVGTIPTFFYALLFKRAFQISGFDPIPGLEPAFDPSASPINWLRPPMEDELIRDMRHTTGGAH